MRILIVEDNEISAGILESNLNQRNYQTLVARTGTEALKYLEAYWDIGLALADIMLPEMDGLELVRRMREDPAWKDIPVIVCTSLADTEHVAEAARLGCRHYLLKPIDRVKLIMMADKLSSSIKIVPVLGDPTQLSIKYGLSSEALDRLYQAFAEVVNNSIATLDPDSSENPSSSASIDFAKLMEGAVTLGADRLLGPVQTLQSKSADAPPTSKELNDIFSELKLIQRALSARSQRRQTSETIEDKTPTSEYEIGGSAESTTQTQ
jgi:CheY-like chemotaxis protein